MIEYLFVGIIIGIILYGTTRRAVQPSNRSFNFYLDGNYTLFPIYRLVRGDFWEECRFDWDYADKSRSKRYRFDGPVAGKLSKGYKGGISLLVLVPSSTAQRGYLKREVKLKKRKEALRHFGLPEEGFPNML